MRYSLSFVIEKDIRDEFPFIGLGRTLADIEDGGGKGVALDRVMTMKVEQKEDGGDALTRGEELDEERVR